MLQKLKKFMKLSINCFWSSDSDGGPALLQISVQYYQTGDFVNKGISLKGGSTITINSVQDLDYVSLEIQLQEQFPKGDITVRTITSAGKLVALAIDSSFQEAEDIDIFLRQPRSRSVWKEVIAWK